MKTVIFSGPTLKKLDAKKILDVKYLPPAKHGDILHAVFNLKADVIGIIDGHGTNELAVWHKEILIALAKGVKIYGAAGLGAIRAVELSKFGMIGVGKIFSDLKDNILSSDDEIICNYEIKNNEFKRVSESLVNIKATFIKAIEFDLITKKEYEKVIEISRNLYYPNRTFKNIFDKLTKNISDTKRLQKLGEFVETNFVDQQNLDALELLKEIKKNKSIEKDHKFNNKYGGIYSALYHRYRPVIYKNQKFPLYYISNNVIINEKNITQLKYNAFNRQLSVLFAKVIKVRVNKDEIDKEKDNFQKKIKSKNNRELKLWIEENDLSIDDFNQLIEEEAIIRKLHKWILSRDWMQKNSKSILDYLRIENDFVKWKTKTGRREELTEDYSEEIKELFQKDDNFKELLVSHVRHNKNNKDINYFEKINDAGLSALGLKLELAKEKIVQNDIDQKLKNIFKI